MSGPAGPGGSGEPGGRAGPDGALDRLDTAILGAVRDAFGYTDPPPPDLDQRVLFALSLGDVEAEVARLRREVLTGAGARGTGRVRTLTFDAAGLTIMISVTETGGNRVRVDGWLAPPEPYRVELRFASERRDGPDRAREVTADETGRFVFDQVPRGLAQLLIRPGDSETAAVVTPSVVL